MSSAQNPIGTGRAQFNKLAQNAGNVEKLFAKAEAREVKARKSLRKFIDSGLTALRAARNLDSGTLSDDGFAKYLHSLLDDELKASTSKASTKVSPASQVTDGTARK